MPTYFDTSREILAHFMKWANLRYDHDADIVSDTKINNKFVWKLWDHHLGKNSWDRFIESEKGYVEVLGTLTLYIGETDLKKTHYVYPSFVLYRYRKRENNRFLLNV